MPSLSQGSSGRARLAGRAAIVGIALALVFTACLGPRRIDARRTTGTCRGVCDHYTSCRKLDDRRVWAICRDQCSDIFASAETRRAFERLRCEDAIAFVEGASGRPLGEGRGPASDVGP